MSNIIIEYFDINYYWEKGVPKIKLKFKNIKKEKKDIPIKKKLENGRIVVETGIKYYQHYLGNECGEIVYNERKKLFSKHNLINWYIDNFNPKDKDKLLNYLDNINNKVKFKLNQYYNTPSSKLDITKSLYKKRSKKFAKKTGKINSEKWKDPVWRNSIMNKRYNSGMYEELSKKMKKLYSNDEFKKEFMKSIQNEDRIKKISIASKKMWENWKDNNKEMYRYMINSLKSKRYSYKNYKMNSIEYIMAQILNELKLKWEYEKIFHFENKSYIPDFYIKDYNLIVECYGDFWHANPNKFKGSDILYENMKVSIKWDYDNIKKEDFIKNKYKFLYFWETNINSDIEFIKETIKNEIY